MRRLPSVAAVALLLLPAVALAAARPAAGPMPDDAAWALVAPKAADGAAAGTALLGAADTRGLQQGFAAGLRNGVGFDPFDAGALAAAGVDLELPMVFGTSAGVDLAAVHLHKDGPGTAHLERWLATAGTAAPAGAHRGWQLHLATRADRTEAAYAIAGNQAITARLSAPSGDVRAALRKAIDAALGGKASLANQPLFASARRDAAAPWYVWLRRPDATVAAGLWFEAPQRLRLKGRAQPRRAQAILGSGAAWPAAHLDGALLFGRFELARQARNAGGAASESVRWLLEQACATCDGATIDRAANALAATLAGPAALAVSRIDTAKIRGDRLAPDATPFAWVASLRDPAAAQRALATLSARIGAPGTDRTVPSALGPLLFGIRGDRIYVATDAALRDRLLAATEGRASGDGPPLRLAIDPRLLGSALGDLSVRDALGGGLRAALFAARLQLGPLLQASGPFTLDATEQGGGTYRVDATWELRAP